jgi:hypothetical protein
MAVLTVLTRLAATPSAQLIALTIAETRRLINHLILHRPPDPQHVLRWSLWRRHHQKQARTSHYKHRHQLELNR